MKRWPLVYALLLVLISTVALAQQEAPRVPTKYSPSKLSLRIRPRRTRRNQQRLRLRPVPTRHLRNNHGQARRATTRRSRTKPAVPSREARLRVQRRCSRPSSQARPAPTRSSRSSQRRSHRSRTTPRIRLRRRLRTRRIRTIRCLACRRCRRKGFAGRRNGAEGGSPAQPSCGKNLRRWRQKDDIRL